MTELNIPHNHLCITSSHHIQEIALPLFSATGLNFFSYGRVFKRNLTFALHTNIPLFFSWFKNRSPFCCTYQSDGVYFWDDTQNDQLKKDRQALNLGNGILIVKHQSTFTEVFGFNAPLEQPHHKSFYLNHMDVLNKFCLYFKDKAYGLITQGMQNPFILPETMIKERIERDDDHILLDFKNSLNIKKYHIDEKLDGIKLSKRELQCLCLFLKGNTAVQIANKLQLDRSTIDSFLFTTKNKFKCKERSDLVQLFWDLGILQSNGWFDI